MFSSNYHKYLDTYSLQEIFEFNELSEAEILQFLVEEEFLLLPNPRPVDLE